MEFNEWITSKYLKWRADKIGPGSSITSFAKALKISQQTMSLWMRPHSNPPTSAKYVAILIANYGDEAREILNIKKPSKVEISLDQIPPELRSLLESAITELNSAYAAEGVSPESPRALELATAILGKHGFNVSVKSKDNPG